MERLTEGFEGLKFVPGVELECDATECQQENIKALLLTLATPPKGSKVDTASLVGIWSRLMKTGYFSRVTLSLERRPQQRVVW